MSILYEQGYIALLICTSIINRTYDYLYPYFLISNYYTFILHIEINYDFYR